MFVCEHHSSIAHGRPPMTRQCHAIRKSDKLLDCPFASEDDARLVSQVKIWRVASDISEEFGEDVFLPILENQYLALRRYNIALDSWKADWAEAFSRNPNIGDYPRKGVGLHYHFAKLYLCSHVFRGLQAAKSGADVHRQELSEFANTALLSATSILQVIATDTEFQSFLDGLPLYFDTMIAFAAVFAVKSVREYSDYLVSSAEKVLETVDAASNALKNIIKKLHPDHLLQSVAMGMDDLVQKARAELLNICQDTNSVNHGVSGPNQEAEDANGLDSWDMQWRTLNQPFMANFDFLSENNMISGLDDFPSGFDFT